jgi:hypothetical protein
MINRKQFAAVLGFAFAAVWAASGFVSALLCLVAAAAFYYAAAFFEGEVDLTDVQARFTPGGGRSAAGSTPSKPRVK